MNFLTVSNLSKKYGKREAVRDFSLEVKKGEIYALVGPDGAGKTTILRSLCNLLTPDSGSITIDNFDTAKQFEQVKQVLGYMPQVFSLYPDLSVEENLKFYAGIYGISGNAYYKKAERLYQFSNLKPFKNRRAQALSGGMKQKLALSCALMHDPKILILDEPTTGVDPLSRRQFWEILIGLKKEMVTIIVSTPYMDEVAKVDRATFIFNGRKLAEGAPHELRHLFTGKLYYLDKHPSVSLVEQLNKINGIKARRFGAGLHLHLNKDVKIKNFTDKLATLDIKLNQLKKIQAGLEDCFIQFMEQ